MLDFFNSYVFLGGLYVSIKFITQIYSRLISRICSNFKAGIPLLNTCMLNSDRDKAIRCLAQIT